MRVLLFLSLFAVLVPRTAVCVDSETESSMRDVLRIARAIAVVQPSLENGKYLEYALSIHRASKRYHIAPALLIAIAHQESSFREQHQQGRAGELGITQVLKSWLRNPRFMKEFPQANEATLKKASHSFLYTAWILHNLKENKGEGGLPTWSFYNSRKLHHRLAYYSRVSRHITKLKQNYRKIETPKAKTVASNNRWIASAAID